VFYYNNDYNPPRMHKLALVVEKDGKGIYRRVGLAK
jgi:hypothetical protein